MIKYEAIGRVYLSPIQRRDKYIKQLERWVIVLGFADIILLVLAIALICEVII